MQNRTRRPHRQTRPLTPAEYARARKAYIETGTVSAVAVAIPCDRHRAVLLIEEGGESAHADQPSLREAARVHAAELVAAASRREKALLAEEAAEQALKLQARAKASQTARRHEEAILGDALQSRKDEVSLVRANRNSSLVLAQVNANLLKLSVSVAKSLLEEEATIRKLKPQERLGILRTVAGIVQRTADASRISVNMERLLLGEPTAILGREGGGPSTADMSPEEAEQWLDLANRAFSRRAQRRTVLEADGAPVQSDEDVDLTEALA